VCVDGVVFLPGVARTSTIANDRNVWFLCLRQQMLDLTLLVYDLAEYLYMTQKQIVRLGVVIQFSDTIDHLHQLDVAHGVQFARSEPTQRLDFMCDFADVSDGYHL
jgi:hypothetical protein